MDNPKTILVVDDMMQIRDILRFSLKREGYKVLLAEGGKEALQIVFKEPVIDLIILDIMMPKMNGYEVLAKLKENEATRSIPVIFLTAKSQKGDVLKGIKAGVTDYVLKPYTFDELLRKIDSALNPE